MRTIQILLQLVNSITANPSVLPLLPWEDIRLCLLMELDTAIISIPGNRSSIEMHCFWN